jgi:putative transcriptional regulator
MCPLAWAVFLTAFAPALVSPARAAAEESRFLTGQLLVAAPEMGDPRFAGTVVLVIRHSEEGAMGLVVNRPLAKGPIADLLKGLGEQSEGIRGEVLLYYGGPVEPSQGFILHTDDYVGERTSSLGNGISVTDDVEILRAIANGKGPRQSIVTLGYAGWAPGQLEEEMRAGAWFAVAADKALIFDANDDAKWERASAKKKTKA